GRGWPRRWCCPGIAAWACPFRHGFPESEYSIAGGGEGTGMMGGEKAAASLVGVAQSPTRPAAGYSMGASAVMRARKNRWTGSPRVCSCYLGGNWARPAVLWSQVRKSTPILRLQELNMPAGSVAAAANQTREDRIEAILKELRPKIDATVRQMVERAVDVP